MDYLCGREAQEQFYLLEGSVIPAIKAVAESKPFHESPPGKNHQAHLDSIAFGAPFATHPVNTRLVNEVITLWKDVTDAKMQPREFTLRPRADERPAQGVQVIPGPARRSCPWFRAGGRPGVGLPRPPLRRPGRPRPRAPPGGDGRPGHPAHLRLPPLGGQPRPPPRPPRRTCAAATRPWPAGPSATLTASSLTASSAAPTLTKPCASLEDCVAQRASGASSSTPPLRRPAGGAGGGPRGGIGPPHPAARRAAAPRTCRASSSRTGGRWPTSPGASPTPPDPGPHRRRGDWAFSLKAVRDCPNVYLDLSGA